MTWIFWLSAGALVYSIIGYGVLVTALSRLAPRREPVPPEAPMTFSFLIAAHNEEAHIEAKIRNTLAQDAGDHAVEVIVVSDGSTDRTVALARGVADPRVTVFEVSRHQGKADAINLGLQSCRGDVVVFTDANSLLEPGSLLAIARHFGDPRVGGVCGRITVPSARTGPTGRAEGLYWRYDQAIKAAESRLGGTVSAQGSIYAIRRDLTRPLIMGCADDFLMSVNAVAAGRRLVFEPRAATSEAVSEKVGREMGRRTRSTERGWRALMVHRALMNPLRTGWYGWQLFSHKLVRRLNPLFLIGLFVSNLALMGQHWFYALTAGAQVTFYAAGLLAMTVPAIRGFRPAALAAFFLFTHLAMLRGILRYYSGKKSVSWRPVRE
ncbi:glycosyltransferase family 2 protein [Cereibacter azotoformans]|uniref:Cellulose synthase/poly-beta-1,6-N-acetylglucosamine synthase-like glycosyltransferase n=1 Tax=Cereibacter azotoformans TaxID=43057 RepID=A0A2T5JN23_9RHOB|nr:glycosyltransferase family 2 protein [Cereibacter azotoformans]AXQ95416.1 glycosyltransferase family 2 protein [Cereibacter sphaeroides]PTR08708.1 cellulose synthase/poly-beta-1,6-N-acetylglucosamine synthase-like glycosyltransferase [Cereibacter azotoformans]UIJ32349.1 glycosyltransferase family 2 protein [Cereibacter azotoformans]